MSFEVVNVISAFFLGVCTIIFFAIGQFAMTLKTPMNFWSGKTVPIEAIGDIPAYNAANGRMWRLYGFGWLISTFIILIHLWIGVVLVILLSTLGVKILMGLYIRIYDNYKVEEKEKEI